MARRLRPRVVWPEISGIFRDSARKGEVGAKKCVQRYTKSPQKAFPLLNAGGG